jgi:acyl carrier protein
MTLEAILGPVLGEIGRPLCEEDCPETIRGWDSVRQIEIVVALEDAFDIELSTSEILRLKSVRDILAVLQERGLSLGLS